MTTDPSRDKAPSYKGNWVQDFLVSLVFLTRLPISLRFSFDMGALRTASRCFPIIGIIVGGLSGAVFLVAIAIDLPALLSAFLAIASQALLTGALHEDAIGDVADGFGGGTTRLEKLEIMHDSRVGTYAVLALIFVIGMKVVALSSAISPMMIFAILVSAATVSRALMTWGMYLMPSARTDGLSHSAGRPPILAPLSATVIAVLVAIVSLGNLIGATALLVAIISAALVGIIAYRQIGGQTGDVLGAIQQISELGFIIACVAVIL
ncbi:adenosylcobinamide-GDP ribazoletransferase [Sneathiella marina]|uniref:Adenosylcobinamide-GDP ribazoletransferase n=1 Tax=Sneathiella marina TaxID=2950108 RepID=A0ABY4WCC0_9PROT|nr:adenosylcobinamide-GDP ribazoletransferase [Sneathiella marina]USG62291.1 adenosylcobinamide-GDP ribazoletransferase [Sneathiella marina]